jgi:deoxyribonuclease-4
MEFGLKLWSINTNLIDQAVSLIDNKTFDYIELFVVPDTSVSPFKIDVPYIIHIPHEKFGVNIGDSTKIGYNLQKINECINWANELDAKYLILHAGDGSMETASNVLSEISDNRILIENMTKIGLNGEKMIGYSPDQISELINNTDMGLCLDFGHAIKASISLEIDYKNYIKDFLEFNPMLFHICDGDLKEEKDRHMNIGEGEFDMAYLLKCVEKNVSKYVTVETPRNDQSSLNEDIRNVSALRNI